MSEEEKERVEKERVEKERVEKERVERVEKERVESKKSKEIIPFHIMSFSYYLKQMKDFYFF